MPISAVATPMPDSDTSSPAQVVTRQSSRPESSGRNDGSSPTVLGCTASKKKQTARRKAIVSTSAPDACGTGAGKTSTIVKQSMDNTANAANQRAVRGLRQPCSPQAMLDRARFSGSIRSRVLAQEQRKPIKPPTPVAATNSNSGCGISRRCNLGASSAHPKRAVEASSLAPRSDSPVPL